MKRPAVFNITTGIQNISVICRKYQTADDSSQNLSVKRFFWREDGYLPTLETSLITHSPRQMIVVKKWSEYFTSS
jgi:hypothetical protein